MAKGYNLFFFGCWNKNGCENPNVKKIVENIKEKKYDTGIILGDNIYADKNDNYDIDVMKNGIKCLENIGIPLEIIFGNHDLKDCAIMNYQTNYKGKYWHFKKNYYSKIFQNNNIKIKFISIDTNLLINKNVYHKMEDCRISEKIYTDVENMLKFLEKELLNFNEFHWIIVAGHHPIYAFFQSEDGKSHHSNIKGMGRLYYYLYQIPNIVYICADVHNFQFNVLKSSKYNLHEIVTGTGGGTPDLLPIKIKKNKIYMNKKDYGIISHDYQSSYGYIDMTILPEKIEFSYIQTSSGKKFPHEIYNDYYRKYMKYKKKYLDKKIQASK